MGYEFIPKDNVGTGDVVGPGSSTDTAIAIYDGVTGKLIKNSSVFISSGGDLGIGAAPFAYDTGYYGSGADVVTLGDPTFTNAQTIIFKSQTHEGWIYSEDSLNEFQFGTKGDGRSIVFYPNDIKSLALKADAKAEFSNDVTIKGAHNLILTSSTNDLTLRANNLTDGYTFIFPASQGVSGDVLVNLGSGESQWTDSFPAIQSHGNVSLVDLGSKFRVKEGLNGSMGRSILVGGTVTVSTTAVLTTSEIFLTNRIAGGTLGFLSIGTVINATSFVINSTNVLDTSTINWIIIDPF